MAFSDGCHDACREGLNETAQDFLRLAEETTFVNTKLYSIIDQNNFQYLHTHPCKMSYVVYTNTVIVRIPHIYTIFFLKVKYCRVLLDVRQAAIIFIGHIY